MGLRRKARELALQALYGIDFGEESKFLSAKEINLEYKAVLSDIAEANKVKTDSPIFSFAWELIQTINSEKVAIDDTIKSHLDNWPFEKLAVLDCNLLRIAMCEILYLQTPPPIAINEVVEIAKKYCGEQSGKFINGILDRVYKELKPQTGE
jgi:transcription antitermination protein NusB